MGEFLILLGMGAEESKEGINPFSPKSDHHQLSPCNTNVFTELTRTLLNA